MTADNAPHRRRAHATSPTRGPIPWPLGRIGEPIYRAVITSRNRRFDAGRGVVRFDRVVISVGNLSVGGTGKTPMVAQIIRWLREAGHRPVIAMRGYGASGGESDEAAAYRREFPDVPVVARANRILGLIQHFQKEYEAEAVTIEGSELPRDAVHPADEARTRPVDAGPDSPSDFAEALELARADTAHHSDCIILDDGFQHRQIARDLDIVLIDAMRSPFDDHLLPAGWLREPLSSLKRAGLIVLTHAESVAPADITALDRQLAQLRSAPADAIARHEWSGITVLDSGREQTHSVNWLASRRVFAVCAIGNPAAFVEQAQRTTGIPLAGQLLLRDHDPYAERTIRGLIDEARATGAQAIITTEKDWSKLARIRPDAWPCPIARVQLAMGFERGGEELRRRVLETVAAGAPE